MKIRQMADDDGCMDDQIRDLSVLLLPQSACLYCKKSPRRGLAPGTLRISVKWVQRPHTQDLNHEYNDADLVTKRSQARKSLGQSAGS